MPELFDSLLGANFGQSWVDPEGEQVAVMDAQLQILQRRDHLVAIPRRG